MARLLCLAMCCLVACDAQKPQVIKHSFSKADQHSIQVASQTSPASAPKTLLPYQRVHGVKHLPKGHPCHDASPLLLVEEDGPADMDGHPTGLGEHTTIGAYRKKKDSRFGPRLSKGMLWTTSRGEFALSSCQFIGHNIERRTCPEPKTCNPTMTGGATFHVQHLMERNDTAYSSVTLMHRKPGGSTWTIVSDDIALHWGDGECCPSFAFAHAELLSVQDLNHDNVMEVTYMEMVPCHHANGFVETQSLCEPYEDKDGVFAVAVFAREGVWARRSHVLVNTKGKILTHGETTMLGTPSLKATRHLKRVYTKQEKRILSRVKVLARAHRNVFPSME